MITELQSVETEQYSLCVFECVCGFHIGIDATYLDQVGEVKVRCPSCQANLYIKAEED